ncbi:MAG: NAD(P)-dependent oxidoreductase, partial [Actinomycetota bacterium]|nr:NAD(P)-dependent oxidoreductase [Actinomycetota bacterium]
LRPPGESGSGMRVVVTGARGKVGSVAVDALTAAGHDVVGVDRGAPVFERPRPGEPRYMQADVSDAGDAFAVVRGAAAVVHAAALPEPTQNPPHTVFANNLLATFNVVEAAVRFGVRRLVNISSETVPGFFFAERGFLPDYLPVDEEHPVRPQDPYALSKHFGEQLADAAVRRSDLRCLSLRPSWVQHEGNYGRNLGPGVRDPGVLSPNFWSYIDVYDLADAIVLAVESDLGGHEVCYIASPDNATGRPFAELVARYYGDDAPPLGELEREDASGISCAKARRLLGWRPSRSWRDYLDEDGWTRPGVGSGSGEAAQTQ